MKKFLIFALLFSTAALFPQDEKSLSEKIDEIKGDIHKISVQTAEGEFIFEGDEAEKLFDRINNKNNVRFFSLNDDDLDDGFEFFVDDFSDNGSTAEEIKVIAVDGKKKVVVKTEKNGEEKIEVYEGEEAEKYLEENKDDTIRIKINSDDDGEKKFIIKKKVEKKKSED